MEIAQMGPNRTKSERKGRPKGDGAFGVPERPLGMLPPLSCRSSLRMRCVVALGRTRGVFGSKRASNLPHRGSQLTEHMFA